MLATLSREVALRELDIEHQAIRDLINNLYATGTGTTVNDFELRVGPIEFQSDSVVLIHGVTYKKK